MTGSGMLVSFSTMGQTEPVPSRYTIPEAEDITLVSINYSITNLYKMLKNN